MRAAAILPSLPSLAALCLTLGLAFLLAGQAVAQTAPSPSDRAAIQQVIAAQIDAFRHDDGAAAFGYASPHIQSLFGDPATFLAMAKNGYAPVTHPSSVSFGALESQDGQLVQHVELVGPNGEGALALYTMEREPNGAWRIAGCQLVRTERIET